MILTCVSDCIYHKCIINRIYKTLTILHIGTIIRNTIFELIK